MDDSVQLEQLLPLTQSELDLIHLIRTRYRFGFVEIETRDGAPIFLKKTVEREKLG